MAKGAIEAASDNKITVLKIFQFPRGLTQADKGNDTMRELIMELDILQPGKHLKVFPT